MAFDWTDGKRAFAQSWAGTGAEPWTQEQVKFSELARDAARRALWFLRLVEPDSGDTLRTHAQQQAFRQLGRVIVPHVDDWAGGSNGLPDNYSGAIEPSFIGLVKMWGDVIHELQSNRTLASAELRAAESELERFIDRSRPLDTWVRFTYADLPAIGMVLRQHLALLVCLAVVLSVLGFVEAIRSLLRNDWFIAFGSLLAAAAPIFVMYRVARRRDRRNKSTFFNLGARSVHALPASMTPEPWLPWHPDRDDTDPRAYGTRILQSLLWKVALHVVAWVAVGFIVWGSTQTGFVDPVSLTVYMIVILSGMVALLGGVLDFADMHSRAPLRGIVLVGVGAVGLAALLWDSGVLVLAVLFGWLLLIRKWAINVRNTTVTGWVGGAMATIAIVAIGLHAKRTGDERAREFTGHLVALDANDWPRGDRTSGPVVVVAASGGGSRAAIFTARTLSALDRELPDVAANLQAISSVSGGSLANAVYLSRRLRASAGETDSLSACQSPLDSAVREDFIGPVILNGAWSGRGRAIEQKWRDCPVALGALDMADLARRWRADSGSHPPFPVPLFNSVSLERNAVVLSPIAQQLVAAPFDAEARSESLNAYRRYRPGSDTARVSQPTWVHYRSGIYHLSDLVPDANTPLAEAVRASANFPFGFPLVEIETFRPLWYSTSMAKFRARAEPEIVRLTDGGALSNSGMWPVLPLLSNTRQRIGDDRGVLLIVVDANLMPVAPATDRQFGLFQTILDKDPKGERVHLLMLQQLKAMYGPCFEYVHVGVEPTTEFNVYTTWALDRESTRKVDSAFSLAWRVARPRVDSLYDALGGCRNSGTRWAAASWRGRIPIN